MVIIMNSIEIGNLIRHVRKKSGLSQQELAKMASVGKTVVFDIEKGKTTVQLNSLLKVIEVLNIQLQLNTPFAQPRENIS